MKSDRDFLKNQLLETKELKDVVGDHPLMSHALAQREAELLEQIAAMPEGQLEPKALLLFSGDPVQGSIGIDAGFAGRALTPFQNMVKADYADRWHGVLAGRGRRTGENESQMLLTALPRGSFGLLLEQAHQGDLFAANNLAGTLAHVGRLIESSAKSDADFAVELNETAPRVLQGLKRFLAVVAKGRSGLKFEAGNVHFAISPIQAHEALDRVSNAITESLVVIFEGTFKGALLESWRFDFMTRDGHLITGHLHENIQAEHVAAFDHDFVNRECAAVMEETKVQFKSGRVKTTHALITLIDLEAPELVRLRQAIGDGLSTSDLAKIQHELGSEIDTDDRVNEEDVS